VNTIDKLIAARIREWPAIYQCRADVLHHWLCVCGSGSSWGYFTLKVSVDTNARRKKLAKVDLSDKSWDNQQIVVNNLKITNERRIANNAEAIAVLGYGRLNPMKHDLEVIYPLSEDSILTTFPDRIRRDWAEIIVEMILIIFKVPAGGDYCQNHRLSNIRIADIALARLTVLFSDIATFVSHQDWLIQKGESEKQLRLLLKTSGIFDEVES
jgi:hypothetical protein